MAPCKHCAKQAADAISARQDLSSEQHKTIALAKELDSFRQKAVDTAAVCHLRWLCSAVNCRERSGPGYRILPDQNREWSHWYVGN